MNGKDENSHSQVPRYAGLAARVLIRARRLEPGIPSSTSTSRERAIAALAGALAARPVRTARRRIVVGLAAAAVVVIVVGLLQLDRGRQITVRLDGGPPVAVGTVVRADSGRPVSLSLSTGTRLRLSDAGRMKLAAIDSRQHFVLETGRLWANVAPLASRHRFLITTPDVEVEVRGTAFEILVGPAPPRCGEGRTRVKVSEGLVTVRQGHHLWQVAAGEIWPAPCPPAPQASSDEFAMNADAHATTGTPQHQTRSLASRDRAAISGTASDLRQQNDLFAGAMAARRRGDVVAAQRGLDELVARFPLGALADTAREELAALKRPSNKAAGPQR